MIEKVDKARLWQALMDEVAQELEQVLRAQKTTQDGATHEEARAENDKDTRALESTYLARGLADRVANMENAVAALQGLKPRAFGQDDPVALGALVEVEFEDNAAAFLLAPAGGGLRLHADGVHILVLTTQAPAGKALIGRYQGEDIEYGTPQGRRAGTIVALR